MSIDFDTSELGRLAADLAAAGPKVTVASSASLTKIAATFAAAARSDAPVDTGELEGSIKVRGGDGYRTIVADAGHAFYVEFGTGDTPPQPYMWPQVPEATRALLEAHEDAGEDIL